VFLEHAWSPDRVKWLNEHARMVVVNGGARRAHIHLNCGRTWQDAPTFDETMGFVQKFSKNDATKNSSQTLIDLLVAQKAVDAAMARTDTDRVLIVSKQGRATVERRVAADGTKQYRYCVETGDPLGYNANPKVAAVVASGFADAQTWLDATADTMYPDIVPQSVEFFDSPRAGQIIIFAADGWDFSDRDLGGHGSIMRYDMIVPMVFTGPDIAPGHLHTARIVDVMPTILDIMGLGDRTNRFGTLDGRSLLSRMRRDTAASQPTSAPALSQ
jgi:RNA polymerase-binding transcription factor DksA